MKKNASVFGLFLLIGILGVGLAYGIEGSDIEQGGTGVIRTIEVGSLSELNLSEVVSNSTLAKEGIASFMGEYNGKKIIIDVINKSIWPKSELVDIGNFTTADFGNLLEQYCDFGKCATGFLADYQGETLFINFYNAETESSVYKLSEKSLKEVLNNSSIEGVTGFSFDTGKRLLNLNVRNLDYEELNEKKNQEGIVILPDVSGINLTEAGDSSYFIASYNGGYVEITTMIMGPNLGDISNVKLGQVLADNYVEDIGISMFLVEYKGVSWTMLVNSPETSSRGHTVAGDISDMNLSETLQSLGFLDRYCAISMDGIHGDTQVVINTAVRLDPASDGLNESCHVVGSILDININQTLETEELKANGVADYCTTYQGVMISVDINRAVPEVDFEAMKLDELANEYGIGGYDGKVGDMDVQIELFPSEEFGLRCFTASDGKDNCFALEDVEEEEGLTLKRPDRADSLSNIDLAKELDLKKEAGLDYGMMFFVAPYNGRDIGISIFYNKASSTETKVDDLSNVNLSELLDKNSFSTYGWLTIRDPRHHYEIEVDVYYVGLLDLQDAMWLGLVGSYWTSESVTEEILADATEV